MPTTARTLRKLPAFTRKYYRLVDELQSVTNRLKNMRPKIQELETMAAAELAREARPPQSDTD